MLANVYYNNKATLTLGIAVLNKIKLMTPRRLLVIDRPTSL